jgi:hypothetical protein
VVTHDIGIVPDDEFDLGLTESQVIRNDNLPEAYKPEMLATLEDQCRNFFMLVSLASPNYLGLSVRVVMQSDVCSRIM